jgi:hypothetical protein
MEAGKGRPIGRRGRKSAAGRGTGVQVFERKLVVNEMVVAAELEGEAVLLNVETGIYYGLDEVGTRIWKCLEEGLTREDMVLRLLDEYDVEASALRRDVSEFLATLESNGLISASNA